ncbi:MAG: NAD-dependent deacylase [Reichenbachiella sp.]
MKKLIVLTGAGISAESGIKTFRDSNGLWEGHDVMEVASPEGWEKDRPLVLDFYNQRRKQALTSKPNAGHLALAELEQYFDVTIITQNVDNLHEQAGSTKVIHIHGELFKSRSTVDEHLIYDVEGWQLNEGDLCEKGSQLRPNIVWFGEMVPLMDLAMEESLKADLFIVVGTSLVVYPAAGLINYVPGLTPKYIIDPHLPEVGQMPHLHLIEETATVGVPKVAQELIESYG